MKDAFKILIATAMVAALYMLPGFDFLSSKMKWYSGAGIFIALCFVLKSIPIGVHLIVGWALVIETLRQVCHDVPMKEIMLGESYLIFYFHFPSAIACLAMFLMAGGISFWQLKTRDLKWDQCAAACIELALIACSITLLTGMTWAQAAWGRPWVWSDPRLLTVAIMWFTYMAYLMFRMAIDDPVKRARFSSVLGILFAINVPFVWYAIKLFGSEAHPMELTMEGTQKEIMTYTRWYGAGAFFILYMALWRLRASSMRADAQCDQLEDAFMRQKI